MIVADAGPIIADARMGRLDLLHQVVGEWAPEAHLEAPQALFQLRQHIRTGLHAHGEPFVPAEDIISQQILTKQY